MRTPEETQISEDAHHPSVFISYSWDDDTHKNWVRELAAKLRSDGIDVKLDQWELVPGDQLPAFMERSICDNDYVLIICTPGYKARSEERKGGVGYEGDIMTGEILAKRENQKYIPILRHGSWHDAAPSWLVGKYYVDMSESADFGTSYSDLTATIYKNREKAPPLGPGMKHYPAKASALNSESDIEKQSPESGEIKIKGIIADKVTEPRRDGTRGSALYSIPFQLSSVPSHEWAELFVLTWDNPPAYTSMHRPGIASVQGSTVVLDGTTIEEVEECHRDTLLRVVAHVNKKISKREAERKREDELARQASEEHKRKVEDASQRIKFDD